jgi:hypothetical protein
MLHVFVLDPSAIVICLLSCFDRLAHCSIFSHLPHHPPMYRRLHVLDAIAMDNHKTVMRMDIITTLSYEILESVAAIIVTTSSTPLIDIVNLRRSPSTPLIDIANLR